MKKLIFPLLGLLTLSVVGCGSSDAGKTSTEKDIADFKGDPSSPAVQNSLRAHFGGPPPGPAGAPPAAGK